MFNMILYYSSFHLYATFSLPRLPQALDQVPCVALPSSGFSLPSTDQPVSAK